MTVEFSEPMVDEVGVDRPLSHTLLIVRTNNIFTGGGGDMSWADATHFMYHSQAVIATISPMAVFGLNAIAAFTAVATGLVVKPVILPWPFP